MDIATAKDIWRRHLDGNEAQMYPPLPNIHYRPKPDRIVRRVFEKIEWLSEDVVQAETTIRAAWAILVAQYTATDQVVFGVTSFDRRGRDYGVEKRRRPATRNVPFKVDIANDVKANEFLHGLCAMSRELSMAEGLGIETICTLSDDAEQACGFQTLIDVDLRQEPSDTTERASNTSPFPGVSVSDYNSDRIWSRPCLLEVQITRLPQGLDCLMTFDSHVLSIDQTLCLQIQLEHVMYQLCAPTNASRVLSSIDWVSPHDLQRIWSWNATVPERYDACMHDLISEKASSQSDAPAICAWDGSLTYGELENRSTSLALHLVGMGVGRGVIVPLCFEKSMWFSVAYLAVFKAGGTCVAMDAAQPEAYLHRICQQVSGRIMLSSCANRPMAERLTGRGGTVVEPELFFLDDSPPSKETILPVVDPSDSLFVVFTSGSTGTPKGAIITHSNFASAILHQSRAYGMISSDRVLGYASYAFDMSWMSALYSLLAGACLVVPSDDERRGDIAASIRKYGATHADLTPSVTRLIEPSEVPSLRQLNTSGEALLLEDMERWSALQAATNGYGPAECTGKSHMHDYISPTSKRANELGRSIGLNSWIVHPDDHSKLAVVGSIGELCLEGPLVGAGYIGEPEKTAASFINDPPWLLRGGPGHAGRHGRVYKTGDLFRYHLDGSIVFIKRRDAQVKIRGQRVELGEVEVHVRKALSTNRGEASVVADMITPNDTDGKILTAFFSLPTSYDEADPTAHDRLVSDATKLLQQRVPSYMVPGAFVFQACMPLGATGKTDRRKLRKLGNSLSILELTSLGSTATSTAQRRVPSSEVERRLQLAWASALRVSPGSVGLDDDFLRVGGDSIVAIRLVSTARRHGLLLNVADIFQKRKLEALASVATEVRSTQPDHEEPVNPFELVQANETVEHVRHRVATMCQVNSSSIQDIFPCTPLQAGLMALSVQRRGKYVARFVLPLKRCTDVSLFAEAWQRMQEITPILRTRIVHLDKLGLVQAVIEEPFKCSVEDASVDEYLRRDQAVDTNLGKPLVRYGLITDRGLDQTFFVWTVHHSLFDGWSANLTLHRVQRMYMQQSPSPTLSFQSFVKYIRSDTNSKQWERVWIDYLEGLDAPAFPTAPTSRPSGHRQMLQHKIDDMQWPEAGVTPSTAIRAALAVTIMHYTGFDDTIFGSVSIGRQAGLSGVDGLVGPTIATVPVRVVTRKEERVTAMLERVQRQAMQMTAVEQLGLQRIRLLSTDAERACQFQTLLTIQPRQEWEAEDCVFDLGQMQEGLKPVDEVSAFDTYPLMLECNLGERNLICRLSFAPETMDNEQIIRFCYTFEQALRQLCNPLQASKSLGEVDFISPQDVRTLWSWHSTVPTTENTCMHDLIRRTVQRQPNSLAVRAWDGDMTYHELDARSDRLAHELLRRGISDPNSRFVPLCFKKSVWTSVAALGVMKAGGASVALDCTLPEERLRSVVTQASPRIILASTQESVLAHNLAKSEVIIVDDGNTRPLSESDSPAILPAVSSTALLYAVFTSGSTGVPKGAAMSHRGFCSAIKHQASALCYSSSLRTYQFVSHSFDAFWHDTLRTFASGGILCVPSEHDRLNDLAGSFARLGANSVSFPSSTARLVEPQCVPGLKHMIFGGEQVVAADVARWKGKVDHIINVYGPAECVPPVAIALCNPDSREPPGLGRGVGVNIWLVDPQDYNKLVPIGAIGEALIEGPLVGEGYIGESKHLTDSVFISAPTWYGWDSSMSRSGEVRLYKTGDLMRYNGDGTLVFIARKDAQVKLNGQRFELEEVEQHLYDATGPCDKVQVAAEIVTSSVSTSAKGMLVAFYSTESNHTDDCEFEKGRSHDLRTIWTTALPKRLPKYMVPAAFISLHHLPKTASGKIDRRSLRQLGNAMSVEELTAHSRSGREHRPPSTDLERHLQDLWALILHIPKDSIGIDDNFLEIGGDSIAAIQLVSAARDQGIHLAVADVFKYPILLNLAANATATLETHDVCKLEAFSLLPSTVDREYVRRRAATACGVHSHQVEDVYPCTPLQEALLAQTAKRTGDNIAHFTLELRPDIDLGRLEKAWQTVCSCFDILRTRIVELDEIGLVQVVTKEPVFAERAEALKELSVGGQQAGLGTPLTRATFVEDRDKGLNHFVWDVHHAVYDGWSIEVLMQSLVMAYQGETLQTPPSFRTFIAHLQTSVKDAAESFWTQTLADLEAVLWPALPSTHYQPRADTTYSCDIRDISWPRRSSVTASTILRGTLSLLIGEYTASSDVVFGATVIGRQVPVAGIDRMAGPTIATVPVRARLDAEQSVQCFLDQIQEQAVESMNFEQIGLKEIQHMSGDTEQACRFQTLLVVQPAAASTDPSTKLFRHSIYDEDSHDKKHDNLAFNSYALQVVCNLAGDGLTVEFLTDSSIFDLIQLRRISRQFEHILRQICTPSSTPAKLSCVKALTPHDRDEIWKWNARAIPSMDESVPDLINAVVKRQPSKPAICAWDGSLTYGELDVLSTKLAYSLLCLGVGAGTTVPLLFEKSIWMSVAMLAVVKTGAASVALDSVVPETRLRLMTEQVSFTTIICSSNNAHIASRLAGKKVVLLDKRLVDKMPGPPAQFQLPVVNPSNTFYVAFTSGSTGHPKGVVVSHRQFSSAIHYQQRSICITEASRVYDYVSYGWDGVWLHLFFTLSAGATLCVPSESDRTDRIAGSIRDFKANYIHLTPTISRLLQPSQVPELTFIGLVGEAMLPSDIDQWTRDNTKLYQLYGPTECTPLSSVEEAKRDYTGSLTIGRGLGVNMWIMRTQSGASDLAPIGAIGELVLEGPIVSNGYLSGTEGASSSFLSGVSWLEDCKDRTNCRAYRTGDLVRYASDGRVVFIGRKDSQVKIRGQRVELSDIESCMNGILTDLSSAWTHARGYADMLIPSGGSSQVLVAFIHIQPNSVAAPYDIGSVLNYIQPSLVQRLTDSLPRYMVPKLYLPVAHVATTATGKLDRKALRKYFQDLTPEQIAVLARGRTGTRKPSTKMEICLQQLWARVLQCKPERLGAEDSFFQVGGDSVSAMRLAGAARERGLQITVAEIFKNPKLESMAIVTRLMTAQRADLAHYALLPNTLDRELARKQAAAICNVEVEQVEDIYPCTPLQEGLLAVTARRCGAYTASYNLSLRSSIDIQRFREAWTEVVCRTPILRTRVVDFPGHGLLQVVLRNVDTWTIADGQDWSKDTVEIAGTGIGLPLSWASLNVDTTSGARSFIWTIHHALYDGWSRALVVNALERVYYGEALPRLLPFHTFIDHLAVQDRTESETFFRCLFEGIEAPVYPPLPTPAYEPRANSSITHIVSDMVWPQGDITPSTIVRAAWSIVSAEYTGSTEALFGVTVMGRQALPEGECVIGPTIATIPVRVRLDKRRSIEWLLREVQLQAVQAMAFEQIGLQNLRRISSDTERACQFQTLLVVQPRMLADHANQTSNLFEHALSDERVADTDNINAAFSTYALQIACDLGERGLVLNLVADTNVVNDQQLHRMLRQFEHVLRTICEASGNLSLGEIDTLNGHDHQEIWAWNASSPPTVSGRVHDLIGAAIRVSEPGQIAIDAWDGRLTYTDLDRLSTQLAHHLGEFGVGSGVLVPLCFEKSVWTPVAQLAVMKAGGASVLLDINAPEQRMRAIVTQVKPVVLLSSIAHEALSTRLANSPVVPISGDRIKDMATSAKALPMVKPSDLLYVVFTSGSTGTPKGALVTHENWCSAIRYQQRSLRITSHSRIYDFVSYAFDVAWSNVLNALSAGACLCIPSESDRQENIAESINTLKANYAHLTPTVARTIEPSSVPDLSTVALIGEPVSSIDVAQWARRARLLNTYGPAECTPTSTVEDLSDADPTRTPRIGRAIGANVWIVQRDNVHRLCPIGAIGELVIEGPIVGRGYLEDEAKTASAFIDNPEWLSSSPCRTLGRQGRVYRTGDLVSYDWDSSLKFHGRGDTQVKIRGQRVELGDVEKHLHRLLSVHGDFETIADVLRPKDSENPVLVAFIAAKHGSTPSHVELESTVVRLTEGLEQRLPEQLPAYMVPTFYIPVAEMPATVTGKRNRAELRSIGQAMSLSEMAATNQGHKDATSPATETERSLQQIWASILDISTKFITANDSFLRLGGDSIMAMRFVRVAKDQGFQIHVRDVFTHPRLEDLAKLLDDAGARNCHDQLSAQTHSDPPSSEVDESTVRSISGQLRRPVTSFQKRCLDAALATHKEWWNYLWFDFPRGTSVSRITEICQTLWDQFDACRTIFTHDGERYVQHISADDHPNYEVLQDRRRIADVCKEICLHDFAKPAELGTCFTKFFVVAGLGDTRTLILRLSHAQYDGLALKSLVETLGAAYSDNSLPSAPSFTHFIDQQLLNKSAADRFWDTLLEDVLATPVPKAQEDLTFRDSNARKISLVRTIGISVANQEMTLATTFTATCACAIAQVTSQQDVVFGRLVTGRSTLEPDLQEVMGCCASIVPVRVSFSGAISMEQAQEQVQEQYAQGLAYHTIGLGDSDASSGLGSHMSRFGFNVHFLTVDDQPTFDLGGFATQLRFCELPAGDDAGEVDIFARVSGSTISVSATAGAHRVGLLNELLGVVHSTLSAAAL